MTFEAVLAAGATSPVAPEVRAEPEEIADKMLTDMPDGESVKAGAQTGQARAVPGIAADTADSEGGLANTGDDGLSGGVSLTTRRLPGESIERQGGQPDAIGPSRSVDSPDGHSPLPDGPQLDVLPSRNALQSDTRGALPTERATGPTVLRAAEMPNRDQPQSPRRSATNAGKSNPVQPMNVTEQGMPPVPADSAVQRKSGHRADSEQFRADGSPGQQVFDALSRTNGGDPGSGERPMVPPFDAPMAGSPPLAAGAVGADAVESGAAETRDGERLSKWRQDGALRPAPAPSAGGAAPPSFGGFGSTPSPMDTTGPTGSSADAQRGTSHRIGFTPEVGQGQTLQAGQGDLSTGRPGAGAERDAAIPDSARSPVANPPTSDLAAGRVMASGFVVGRPGDGGPTQERGATMHSTVARTEPQATGRPFANPASPDVGSASRPSGGPTTISVRSVDIGAVVSPKETSHMPPSPGTTIHAKPHRDVALPETALRADPAPPAIAAAPAPVQIRPKPEGVRSLKEAVAVLRGAESDTATARFETHAPVSRAEPGVAARPEAPRFAAPQVAETLIRHPGRGVEVTLNPEELGRVRMALSSHDGAISVTITGDRIETLDLMRRHIDVLAQEFRRLGFDHVGFDFRQSGTGGQRTAQSGPSLQGPETEPEAFTPPPVRRPAAVSGLDMRV